MNDVLAGEIHAAAVQFGYDKCAMVPVEEMAGYAEKLAERIALFPETEPNLRHFFAFADPVSSHPWAKSVVVCARHYGKYRIPAHLRGMIGKSYLVDARRDENAPAYRDSIRFGAFLEARGLRVASERKFGITAYRWAAMRAGIGLVRRNNFFYTEKGSWVSLEAWLVDAPLDLRGETALKHCPESCGACVKACPTRSLREPYAMNRSTCVSCITTWDGRDMPNERYRKELGGWVYGCDACQDACPFNARQWREEEDFPGLAELGDMLGLEQIVGMEYGTLQTVIQPKFWYIGRDDLWKWKVNALNAMHNTDPRGYRDHIRSALDDAYEQVREMAAFLLKEAGTASARTGSAYGDAPPTT